MTYQPKHRKDPVTKFEITLVESERGWGRDEWTEQFDTREEAQTRISEVNANNTALVAPDYYIMAYSEIRTVQA